MARTQCPLCLGKGLVADLNLVDKDLDYSRGSEWATRQAGSEGEPKQQCFLCKGQGWLDDSGYPTQFDLTQFDFNQFD